MKNLYQSLGFCISKQTSDSRLPEDKSILVVPMENEISSILMLADCQCRSDLSSGFGMSGILKSVSCVGEVVFKNKTNMFFDYVNNFSDDNEKMNTLKRNIDVDFDGIEGNRLTLEVDEKSECKAR